jgi:hypothetical protein
MSLFPVFDHVAINVRQRLDEAAQSFMRLGFSLTPRGYHSMGSANHLAVFATDYLEILGLPPDAPVVRRELLEWPCGINGLVFATDDVSHTERELAARGVATAPSQSFTRPVTLPNGETHAASFTTLTVARSEIDYGRVYFCQHGTRHLVWRDEFREHRNGVVGLAAFVIAAQNPDEVAGLYRRMFGAGSAQPTQDGFTMAVGLGRLDVISTTAARERFGLAPDDGAPTRMAALVLRTRSLATARAVVGFAPSDFGGRLVIAGEATFGVAIEFVE